MQISGFTFVRNAIINDYPIIEAITSILPICDEFIVALGNGEDDTERLIKAINSPKIKIIYTTWDDSLREGGKTFALETDKAFREISKNSDWAFYIQGDEVIHERYLPLIKREMQASLNNKKIEGLLLKYVHFYGSYDYYASSRRWYRREVRILKNINGIHSYRDAQGFRLNNRKIRVKEIDAFVYHYGWVKPPAGLNKKVRNFNTFYRSDSWIEENIPEANTFDYGNADSLLPFNDSHPLVMQKRILTSNWKFSLDPLKIKKKMSLRRQLLKWFEEKTGIRLFEYKNYTRIE